MEQNKKLKIVIIGGGAAGFFAAIAAAEANPSADITILERGKDVLQKVKISGGGRCNVTHACFVASDLVKNYPRGEKALLSPFSRFSPTETVEWFDKRGVKLKIEADGRMFPTTNNSQTIVDCLLNSAKNLGVKVLINHRAESFKLVDNQWFIKTSERNFQADKLMIAAGSSTAVWDMLAAVGHTIVAPVPSLFTFNITDFRISGLAGLSVPNAVLIVENSKLKTSGPLLVTHWGMSGPAILRLSAWGARELFDRKYSFKLRVNWLGERTVEETKTDLNHWKSINSRKFVATTTPQYLSLPNTSGQPQGLPTRLWQRLVAAADISENLNWADVSKKQIQQLAEQLAASVFEVNGKSTFKEEFVTAGGVRRDEVNFKTFESKLFPNLFFAGEVLDIDAITGGFNFQAAWSGGWIAGKAMTLSI